LQLFLPISSKTGGVFMNSWIFDELNRREFMKKTALTGAAAYLGIGSDYGIAAVEPPPETTTVRFSSLLGPCWVPQLVAEPLLREEGFTDIQYIKHEKIWSGRRGYPCWKGGLHGGFHRSVSHEVCPWRSD